MAGERCVLTLPLKTEIWQEDIINKRFEIARNVYNAMLGYELKKLRRMEADQEYVEAIGSLYELAKNGKKGSAEYKAVGRLRAEKIREYGFSEFDFISDVSRFASYFSDNLGSNAAAVSVAQPMWRAFDTMFYGKGDAVHFKKKGSINSVATNGKSFLRVTDGTGKTVTQRASEEHLYLTYGVVRGHHKVLCMEILWNRKKSYDAEMLSYPIRQVRLIRRKEKQRYRYYVQLCLEGKPAIKYTDAGDLKHPVVDGRVGVYVDTRSVTVTSSSGTKRYSLSESNIDYAERAEELQRYMDNSRRATNPDNYNSDGTVKKGIVVDGRRRPLRWNYSKRYLRAKEELAELRRLDRVRRQLHHQMLANEILSLGNDIRVNDYSFSLAAMRSKEDVMKPNGTPASKKRGGKNIGENAPAMLVDMIEQKLKNYGIDIVRIKLTDVPAFLDTKEDADRWSRYLFEL